MGTGAAERARSWYERTRAARRGSVDDRTERNIGRAARLIAEADAVLITAGAGMGVDSGLPDFRGSEGFWRAYPA